MCLRSQLKIAWEIDCTYQRGKEMVCSSYYHTSNPQGTPCSQARQHLSDSSIRHNTVHLVLLDCVLRSNNLDLNLTFRFKCTKYNITTTTYCLRLANVYSIQKTKFHLPLFWKVWRQTMRTRGAVETLRHIFQQRVVTVRSNRAFVGFWRSFGAVKSSRTFISIVALIRCARRCRLSTVITETKLHWSIF